MYKLLPDIISNLMKDSTMIDQPGKFEHVLKVLLEHVREDKHHVALVGTFMDRMLHQMQAVSAVLLLNCLGLLKGTGACKQLFKSVQQELPRLRWLLFDETFDKKLKVRVNVSSWRIDHQIAHPCAAPASNIKCFPIAVKDVLKKAFSSIKRYGKQEDKDDAAAVMAKVDSEIAAIHAEAHENVATVHEASNMGDPVASNCKQMGNRKPAGESRYSGENSAHAGVDLSSNGDVNMGQEAC